MRAIEGSSWLHTPVLDVITAEGGQSAQSTFTLKATLGKQNTEATKVGTK
jgi:hypothetical protein